MKNLTREQTIELVDILVDISLTKDCESHYISNDFYLRAFCKKYSEVNEKVLDRFINFKTRAGMRAMGDDPDQWKDIFEEQLRGSRYMELLKSFFRNENQIYFKNDVTHVTFTISH